MKIVKVKVGWQESYGQTAPYLGKSDKRQRRVTPENSLRTRSGELERFDNATHCKATLVVLTKFVKRGRVRVKVWVRVSVRVRVPFDGRLM